MTLFTVLFLKLLPLYAVIALGWIAGSYLKVQKESIAMLLLYVLTPFIAFHGALTVKLDVGVMLLPVFFLISACCMSAIAYVIGGMVWKDNTRNIFAYTAATGNTGYFGIPVAIALMGPDVLGQVVLATMGLVLFENTMGFFVTARGSYTAKQSLIRLIGLPSIYTLILGIVLNALHVQLPSGYFSLAESFRGAYAILGMMIIGLGIAGFRRLTVDWSFLGLCFLAKFVVWPVFTWIVVFVDLRATHLLTPQMHSILLLLSLMPMAANTVVLASALNVKPEKAALGVLASTIFALFFIPLVLTVVRFS